MESITREEFEAHKAMRKGGGQHSPERIAISALAPMTGLKTPCRWRHDPKGACAGITGLHHVRQAMGFKLSGRCDDGTLYVFRYE